MSLHLQTPCIALEGAARETWLKLELLQPPGSFKMRGIGFACEHYVARGAKKFLSSSGGNAGLAVAYAGKKLGVPTTVVVPKTSSEHAKKLLLGYGAEVIVHGASWQEANEHTQSLRNAHTAFIHPFDDPLLWQGHASMIDEMAQQISKPDVVVLSVGGGGLYAGVVEGLRRNAWESVPVLTVETLGADSFYQAMQARERITLPAIASIATSLGARQIAQRAFDLGLTHPTQAMTVSDGQAIRACRLFLDQQRMMVEPACGAALAPVMLSELNAQIPQVLQDARRIAVIVCGGATMSVEQLLAHS